MTDEIKTVDTATVNIGGKTYTIKRLKAGKFYKALKVYMGMIKEITPKNTSDKGEAQVDLNQLVSSIYESWPEKMAEFVSICLSTATINNNGTEQPVEVTTESLLDEAYQEEIASAFTTCLKLNKIADALKNFVTPIEELGVATANKSKE